MKPLFVSALYHPHQVGGAERVVRIIAEALLAQGHEPVVVTAQQGPDDRVDHIDGVKVHYIGLKNVYWPWAREERSAPSRALWHGIDRYNPLMARAVGRILDAEKPDVVNTHHLAGFSCAVWEAVRARSLPLIHTLHDYSLMCPKTTMFKAGRNCEAQCTACKLYTSPGRRLSATVDRVVGVSRFTLDRHLQAGYFRGVREARVIHNALPGTPHSSLAPGMPSDDGGRPLRLGYVGQLIPPKGIEELVVQMRTWDASQCELFVAGKGPTAYEAALRQRAPGNVRFLGFVDPDELYRRIDVLVVPSLWQEPLATTLLEACMHGVPVITSNRGGSPEAVEAGRTGLVYDPMEPQGLREAVEVFLRDRAVLLEMRRHVGRRAEYFRLARMRDEYLQLMADAQDRAGAGASVLRRQTSH